ncbi:MAG TPA: ATP-binding cassette domain-containing protein, partial [Gemmatimonadales bacterium]
PQERDIAMVFQNYALYPHMTVRQNLGFGLRMRGAEPATIDQRVVRVAESLVLDQVLDRKPAQLSGGQRQRVALGRAMVREPQAFLFDEPLSNLDAKLRVETRAELARLHRRLKATIVYVTHDQEEALTLGSRVAVLHEGIVEQVASPMELYRRPATRFVGGFVGSPAMNFLPGTAAGRNDGMTLGVRPHDIALVPPGQGDLDARVDVVEPRGSELLVYLRLSGGSNDELRVVAPPEPMVPADAIVGVRFDRERLHWFDASGRRTT